MSNKWWQDIQKLSTTVPYGDLPEYIKNDSELSFFEDEAAFKLKIKDNKDAWELYRCWLKIYESDEKRIRKSKSILISVLNEPILDINTFQLAIARAGSFKIWDGNSLSLLSQNLSKTDQSKSFNWGLWNNQQELSNRYPWYTLLASWCRAVINEDTVPNKEIVDNLISKSWPAKARCLIAGLAIKHIEFYQNNTELKKIIEWADPKVNILADSLLDNDKDKITLIYEMLMTQAMTIGEKKLNYKEQKEINNLIQNIEFTFEW